MLDETMHKSVVLDCVSGGDTNRKGAIMVVSTNNLGPTFNNGEDCVFSTMVLIAGMTLACVVIPCSSIMVMVEMILVGSINPCGS